MPRRGRGAHRATGPDAVGADCDDPMVKYLAEFHSLRNARGDAKLLTRSRETLGALDVSKYEGTYKLVAVYNRLLVVREARAGSPLRKDEDKGEQRFWELYEQVSADPHRRAGAWP